MPNLTTPDGPVGNPSSVPATACDGISSHPRSEGISGGPDRCLDTDQETTDVTVESTDVVYGV